MNYSEILKTIKNMRVKQNSIAINGYVVVRTKRNSWRIGEQCGDWLRSGTAEEIARRATQPIYIS